MAVPGTNECRSRSLLYLTYCTKLPWLSRADITLQGNERSVVNAYSLTLHFAKHCRAAQGVDELE